MASSLLQVRVDEDLRNECEDILSNLGLTMSSAVRLFLKRVVLAQGLPFPMNLPEDNKEPEFDPVEYLESVYEEYKKTKGDV